MELRKHPITPAFNGRAECKPHLSDCLILSNDHNSAGFALIIIELRVRCLDMVTGIESAGLVLATFPIVVTFLEHYVRGVENIQKWRSYSRELAIYARKLEVQRVTYLNTTEKLLDGIVESEDDLAAMLSNPASAPWQKLEYTDRLRIRLHHSYDIYFTTTHDMMQSLESLKTQLGIDALGKVCNPVKPLLTSTSFRRDPDMEIQ